MASKQHWVNDPSLLYIIFIQLFLSVHSKTYNISSLGGGLSRGVFVIPKKGRVFVRGRAFVRGAFVLDSVAAYSRVRHTRVGRTLEYATPR